MCMSSLKQGVYEEKLILFGQVEYTKNILHIGVSPIYEWFKVQSLHMTDAWVLINNSRTVYWRNQSVMWQLLPEALFF